MFIDFNIGIIIQMTLKDKLELKGKIDQVWNYEHNENNLNIK